MINQHYIIRGGVEGRERLRILAGVLRPTTDALFSRVGVRPGMRCLDAGCGGGDVTVDLARLVGADGLVVGTDIDEDNLVLAWAEALVQGIDNVEFRRGDVVDGEAEGVYDLVYARFFLSHLPDPAGALAKLYRVLRPGGAVVVEDVNIAGHFCDPDCAAFWRYVELYTEAGRRRGVDPTIGRRLPRLLGEGGFACVQMNVVQPAARERDVKLLTPLTMENVAGAIVAGELATPDEIDRVIDNLYTFARDPETVMNFPRIVQVWGRRPAG